MNLFNFCLKHNQNNQFAPDITLLCTFSIICELVYNSKCVTNLTNIKEILCIFISEVKVIQIVYVYLIRKHN